MFPSTCLKLSCPEVRSKFVSMPLDRGMRPDILPMKWWRIFQRWGTNKTFVGIVVARDPHSAIEIAIHQFEIDDPDRRRRLSAELRIE
jgi:hypothetical protein